MPKTSIILPGQVEGPNRDLQVAANALLNAFVAQYPRAAQALAAGFKISIHHRAHTPGPLTGQGWAPLMELEGKVDGGTKGSGIMLGGAK